MRWVYGPLDWPEAIEDPGKHDFLEAVRKACHKGLWDSRLVWHGVE